MQMQSEATEHTRSESGHAAILTRESERQGLTETEIEIYADPTPGDSAGSAPRLKARIRQRHGETEQSRSAAAEQTAGKTETNREAAATYEGATLDEVTVTATKSPSLWERLKHGAAWAAAILILAAAGWLIIKLRKRKTT